VAPTVCADRIHDKGVTMLKEFRDFLLRGNLIELAVAFVMGLAFAAVVNSLVTNIVMPIIAAILGKTDFRNLTFTIHKAIFGYGSFITDVIQFVSIAAAVFFFIVKPVDAIKKRRSQPTEEVVSDEERRHQELLAALQAHA
jgi:large conductance mechanosensitive channel